MKPLKLGILLSSFVFIQGCTTVPASPLEVQFNEMEVLSKKSQNINFDWWRPYFETKDQVLFESTVQSALENSKELAILKQQLYTEYLSLELKSVSDLPSLNATVSSSKSKSKATSNQFNGSLDWTVFNWGQGSLYKDIQKSNSRIEALKIQNKKLELSYELLQAYLALKELTLKQQLFDSQYQLQKSIYEHQRKLISMGFLSPYALNTETRALDQMKFMVEDNSDSIKKLNLEFNRLLKRDLNYQIDVSFDSLLNEDIQKTIEIKEDFVLEVPPVLISYEKVLMQKGYKELAQRSKYPVLKFNGGISHLLGSGFPMGWSLSSLISFSIYNPAQNLQEQIQDSMYLENILNLQLTIENTFQDIQLTIIELENSFNYLDKEKRSYLSQLQEYQTQLSKYNAGFISEMELQKKELNLISNQINYTNAYFRHKEKEMAFHVKTYFTGNLK